MIHKIAKRITKSLGFKPATLSPFLVTAIGSQTIFSFFAIRSVLYNPLIETLGVTNTQFGILMSLTGLGTVFAAVLGFLQNRFDPRTLLIFGLLVNGIGVLIISTTPSYPVLLVIFAVMGFQGMGIFWPAVLNTVRRIAKDSDQGKAFGFLEFVRRSTEFLQAMIAIGIFAVLGGTLGMRAAIITSGIMIIALCILNFLVLPREDHSSQTSQERNKLALAGMITVLRMPEVWLIGLTAAGIYAIYVGLQFFLPFLNNVFVVSVFAGAIFGLVNTSIMGMIASPISGVLADNVVKSPMRYLTIINGLLVVGLAVLLLLPRTPVMLTVTLGLLLVLAFLIYLGRGVYYAPIGEIGMPKEISGGAMAVASFVGYSPMFFAYAIYGYQIDNYSPEQGFNRVFSIMVMCGVVSFLASFSLNLLRRRRRLAQQIQDYPA